MAAPPEFVDVDRIFSSKAEHSSLWLNSRDFAVDVFNDLTTFYTAPAEVEFHVGKLGLIALPMYAFLLAGLYLTILGTPFYLYEEVPMGTYTHWAGDVSFREQRGPPGINSSLDYILDNNWNFARASAINQSLEETHDKEVDNLHLITFFHHRRDVRVQRAEGQDCYETCRGVSLTDPYMDTDDPEAPDDELYPRAADFLGSGHVWAAPDGTVWVRAPESLGDQCSCYFTTNHKVNGIGGAAMVLKHGFSTSYAQGSSSVAPDSEPESSSGVRVRSLPTVVVDQFGRIFEDKVFWADGSPHGAEITVTVDEALRACGACLDCVPEESRFSRNTMCGTEEEPTECPEGVSPSPTIRLTGALLQVSLEYYSHMVQLPDTKEVYDQVRKDPDRFGHGPIAFLHTTPSFDWQSRGSSISQRRVVLTNGVRATLIEDYYRYGVRFLYKPAAGKIGRWDATAMANTAVRYTVLFSYPKMIMGVIVALFLGRWSRLFVRAKKKRLVPQVLFQEYVFSIIQSGVLWQSLDIDGDGHVSVEELGQALWPMVRGQLRRATPGTEDVELYRNLLVMLDTTFPKPFVTEEAAEAVRAQNSMLGEVEQLRGWHQKSAIALAAGKLPINFDNFARRVKEPDRAQRATPCSFTRGAVDKGAAARYDHCWPPDWQGLPSPGSSLRRRAQAAAGERDLDGRGGAGDARDEDDRAAERKKGLEAIGAPVIIDLDGAGPPDLACVPERTGPRMVAGKVVQPTIDSRCVDLAPAVCGGWWWDTQEEAVDL